MVDSLKGIIKVESDKENGTTFMITLPKRLDEPESKDSMHMNKRNEKSVPKSEHH